ncbi:MAG: hypothetical protein K2O24_05455 [Muribaculaceae bacterium]|nr:hypothetical protein [Muribaculaceae bacterium]
MNPTLHLIVLLITALLVVSPALVAFRHTRRSSPVPVPATAMQRRESASR